MSTIVEIERQCQRARRGIMDAADILHDAAYLAQQSGNPELDKLICAVRETIQQASGILIMVPRLKDRDSK